MAKPPADLTFAPLREKDLPLLREWLNRPHMRAFYQKTPISLAEVEAKFLPRIRGEVPTHDHVASLAGRPFGKLQCYRNIDHRAYADEIGVSEGISIDLFIGERDLLGRGLGTAMLKAYVLEVAFPMHPDETKCFICHDLANAHARACSVASGFKPLKEVFESGTASQLLVIEKDK